MKKKILFTVMLLAAFSSAANAQLTTGNPSAKEIRTGNRPQEGDFGLYFGYGAQSIIALVGGVGYQLPIINMKYFMSNKLELRAGLDSQIGTDAFSYEWAKGKKVSATEKSGDSKGESHFLLEPGIAYHFSKHNIIDVYAGAELPLGLVTESQKTFDKVAGTSSKTSRSSFSFGLKPFIGLQCFIANLPMAIGLEYGFWGYANVGAKYKTVAESGGTKQVFYTTLDDTTTQFDKLSAGFLGIDHDIRLTFSYYFK